MSKGKKRKPKKSVEELKKHSNICRGDVLKMTSLAASGHPGGSMSSMEMYQSVYNIANVDPDKPWKEDRDRIVVSHGHTSPGVYATLGRLGFFDIEEAITGFRHVSSRFEGHVTRGIPGVEWTTGNLGQGLSAGVGFALSAKLKGMDYHSFVLMGDAEQAKGQVAEARRTAYKYGLDNLTVLVDFNDAQISGRAHDIMPVNIKDDYLADGWDVLEVNGHDIEKIQGAIKKALENKLQPTAILCYTQIGKGVSFMENDPGYHGKPLDEEQLEKALKELGIENDIEKYRSEREKLPVTPHEKTVLEYAPEISTGEPILYPAAKKVANRNAFGNALKSIGELNRESETPIAVVDCDLKPSTKTAGFADAVPEHFLQFGVAEHNAAAVAGAMSVEKLVTFFTDFGVCGVDETYNQQRLNDINHTNLKLAITHVGTDAGEDGKTHHCLDYVSGISNFFHFKVIVPADPNQTDRAVRYAASRYGNYAIAMGRSKLEPITDENGNPFFDEHYSYEYGKIDELRSCKDAETVIVAMGSTVCEAVQAADEMKKTGEKIGVLNVTSPDALWQKGEHLRELLEGKAILSVEDHNVWTGLGIMLQDALIRNGVMFRKLTRLGIDDYSVSGKKEDLFRIFNIDKDGIIKTLQAQF